MKTLQEQADQERRTIRVVGAYAGDATGKEWHGSVNMKGLGANPRG